MHTTITRKPLLQIARISLPRIAALAGTVSCAAHALASPFATRVIDYSPAPGQNVQNPSFNTPSLALGAPIGGGLSSPDNTKSVTLGGFGGSITLAFDHPVYANRFNPRGMDAIVFGNAFFVSGDPTRRYAECGTIEVSVDANTNGLADDPWYLIAGSHTPRGVPLTRTSKSWNPASLNPSWIPTGRTAPWSTSAFALTGSPFSSGSILTAGDSVAESVWGYADLAPTLLLGDTNADDTIASPALSPEAFYTTPDDPMLVGITPGSGGGSAFSLSWAIDPATGAPANLTRIDFIRITTAIDSISPVLGETSTEVSGVADVRPVYRADWNQDTRVDVQDIFAFLADWFARAGEGGGADFNSSDTTDVQDIFAFLAAWFAR